MLSCKFCQVKWRPSTPAGLGGGETGRKEGPDSDCQVSRAYYKWTCGFSDTCYIRYTRAFHREQHKEINAKMSMLKLLIEQVLFPGMCNLLKENSICVRVSVFCCIAYFNDHLY